MVNVGEKVSPDMSVVQVVDLSRMELEAGVPVGEIPGIKIGQEISFTVVGFATRQFQGKVERINPSAEAGSRSISVFLSLPNPEQALKGGQVGAVLAWLPVNLRADALRRLQLAAQAQAGPVFLFRDALARGRPSPAPLRLLLQPAGADHLTVRLLKRRGPQATQPLRLALPPVLPTHLQARLQAQAAAQQVSLGLADTPR
jgi:hypothetical protein